MWHKHIIKFYKAYLSTINESFEFSNLRYYKEEVNFVITSYMYIFLKTCVILYVILVNLCHVGIMLIVSRDKISMLIEKNIRERRARNWSLRANSCVEVVRTVVLWDGVIKQKYYTVFRALTNKFYRGT